MFKSWYLWTNKNGEKTEYNRDRRLEGLTNQNRLNVHRLTKGMFDLCHSSALVMIVLPCCPLRDRGLMFLYPKNSTWR